MIRLGPLPCAPHKGRFTYMLHRVLVRVNGTVRTTMFWIRRHGRTGKRRWWA